MKTDQILRRLSAVLAIDVAGYSRLMEQDEDGTHQRAQAALKEVVAPHVAQGGGRIVKQTGDGGIAEFPSVVAAVRSALDIQAEMRGRETALAADQRIQFRIGINLGDVIVEPGDIYGDGVNIAARVEALSEPGGLCITQAVVDQIAEKFAVKLTDLGPQSLKNIVRSIRVYRVEPGGHDVSAPGPATIVAFDGRPALVVLPFDDFSGMPGETYFADGITEDITTMLASWRAFPVIARNSAFAYKGRGIDIKAIERDLGVRYVVEGSVRRAGSRVRITAQLIEAPTHHHLYAEHFDRELSDLFAVQDEIVASIAGVLEPELLRVERDRVFRLPPRDMTAYDLLQRGFWQHYQYTREHSRTAQDLFRRALVISPEYTQCLAALSVNLAQSVLSGWEERPDEALAEAFDLAQRAVRTDSRDPLAHFALGLACLHTQRIETAIRANEDAIRINPSYAAACANLGNCNNYIDQPEKAFDAVSRAFRLSPNDPRLFMWMPALTGSHFLAGRFDEAIKTGRRALEMKPEYRHVVRYMVAAMGMAGEPGAGELLPVMRAVDGDLARTEAFLSRYFIARSALDRILEGLRRAGFD